MINVLFAASDANWQTYESHLHNAFNEKGLTVDLKRDHAPETVDFIIYAPVSDLTDFTPFSNCKAVLSLWAGVEKITGNATLTQPLCRMVDPGLTQGMVEWVTGHCLRYHLGMDRHITAPAPHWDQTTPPLASERHVTVLGLGALGTACAQALAGFGFQVTGWSRRPKDVANVTCLSGEQGLRTALMSAEIVVLLLPDTPDTENTLNSEKLSLLPKGAHIINPGRGPLIDDEALLSALETAQVAHATLDVFRIEPLPEDHPYWAHPKVTVTPHIAAETRASTASGVIADNIHRAETGEPLRFLVDRSAGY